MGASTSPVRSTLTKVQSVAYPVGGLETFTDVTRSAAEKARYRMAFSYYGGVNVAGSFHSYEGSIGCLPGWRTRDFHGRYPVCRGEGEVPYGVFVLWGRQRRRFVPPLRRFNRLPTGLED